MSEAQPISVIVTYIFFLAVISKLICRVSDESLFLVDYGARRVDFTRSLRLSGVTRLFMSDAKLSS